MPEDLGSGKGKKSNTFHFVNYKQPGDASNKHARTQVRSHVSRLQHRKTRERLHNTSKSASEAAAGAGSSSSSEPSQSRSTTTTTSNTPSQEADTGHDNPASTEDTGADETFYSPEACRLTSSTLTKYFSQGAISFRTIALQDSDNVVGTSLNDLQLELPSIMRLYKNICSLQGVEFAKQYGAGTGLRFYSFVFTDPILLSTAVLLGVRNQLDVLGRCLDGNTLTAVLQIERFLMRSINDALRDPVRGITDQMLVTVALCAAYEIKHGTGACFHIHMRGLVQMIEMRGGLAAIGDPDPYIPRFLVWLDKNVCKLADCKPYLEDLASRLALRPQANTTVFRTKGLEGQRS